MKIPRKIARCAVFGLTLAASAMLLHSQESKPPEKKAQDNRRKTDKPAPAQQHPAPPRQQSAPPVQHTAPPVEQNARPQRRDAAPPNTPQPVHPDSQAQPNSVPVYRGNPQSTPATQPGRTFGNNPPARGAEPPRGPTQMGARPGGPPARTFTTPSGDVIHRDAGGQVRQVHTSNGTTVYHPPNAPRRVEVVRPGGRVVVVGAPGHGYVQRPVVIRNTTIIKRTYVYNGVPQARIYRPHVYNGVTLAIYTPVRYYRPTFYSYAYNPWARPISYSWGWGGSPWYGYYGGYFTPYPVYASPSLWLTDYMIAATLQAAYQERMASHMASGNMYQDAAAAPMTPEVKQAIADEVRRQIDLERAAGQDPNAQGGQDTDIFAGNRPHVFVVTTTLAVN